MNRTALVTCLAILPAAAVAAGIQEKEKKPPMEMPPEMQEGWKRWQEMCTPGENHAKLAPLLGKWDTKTTILGMATQGTSESRWLVDGRWLQEEWSGEMMGQKGRGWVTLGYDNFKKKYVVSFVDSFSTTMNTAAGAWDQTGKVLTAHGFLDEPMTSEQDKPVKYVWRLLSPDRRVFEVHDLAIGETNTKVIEVEYTRKK
ncbi:MAG: DUF1579 domain-containing protein [Planctomycetes bacterium]|nr:DUF1579 domain-containing protein [Planctomycetota bacterium]